jgi:hypothetical protein
VIKVVATIKRKQGMSLEDFFERYFVDHLALCHEVIPPHVKLVLRRNVQNHARALGDASGEPPYDCVTEIEFDDQAGLDTWTEWYLGPEGRVLRDDEDAFMDKARRVVVVTDVRVPRQYV